MAAVFAYSRLWSSPVKPWSHPLRFDFRPAFCIPSSYPINPAPKASILLVLTAIFLSDAKPYRKPPQAVLAVLNSPLTPTLAIGPTRHFAMQGQPIRYPPIAELAQPMLR